MYVGVKLFSIFVLLMTSEKCGCLRNGPCKTTSSHPGRCVPVDECPAMVALHESWINFNDLNTLKAHLGSCGSSIETARNDALVCCASPAIPIPSATTQSTSTPPPAKNAPGLGLVHPAPTSCTVLPSLCGSRPVGFNVLGGVEDAALVHRWSVFLDLGSKGRNRCAGSVITDRHVLTAAHCLDNKQKDDVTMYFGVYDLREMDTCLQDNTCLKRKPSEFIIHDEYNSNKKSNDIAIIRFEQPLNMTARDIEAICLPCNITYDELRPMSTDDGSVILLSFGWGEIGGGEQSHTRRAVMLKVISGSKCESSVNSKTMCTVGVTEGQDVCHGDSGAPLVWLYKKQMYVVGVVTSGPICGMQLNKPGTAMRISHFKDWVLAKIGS